MRGSAPVGGDDDGVLDAHAADAGEIHAGLDGDDVADEQGITGRRGDPRRLVDLEADAVAGRRATNASAQPAAAITSRRRAVDVGARRRRRATASRPACWLSSTTS